MEINTTWPIVFLRGCLPIACDSGGNRFCLAEGGRVVYIDLDSPEPGKYLVGESFDAFLQKLTE